MTLRLVLMVGFSFQLTERDVATEADIDLRKAITTADNVWRNNTAQAWGTHTAGDLVARGNVRRSLANTSSLLADASQASFAEHKAQWWQNETPNYL